MKDKFLATVRRYGMFSPGDAVAVGVSGGAASMCLLSLLLDCAEELGVSLTAVHVNHGVRGGEADADEAFVRAWCEAAGVPFAARRVNVPALARQTGESVELCARRVRYEVFRSLGTDRIATAHTGSDSVETMLMNLSRGSGLRGLCGIPPVRDNIVRPLIGFTRAETEGYCRENGVPFVTDSTNLSDDYTRNRFRHTVVPQLEAINPAFEANAMRCMELLAKDDGFLRQTARTEFDALFDPGTVSLPVKGLLAEHESVRNRVLAVFFERTAAGDWEYRHIERLEENGFAPCSVTLPSGGHIVSDGQRVFYRQQAPASFGEALPEAVTVAKDGTEPVKFGSFQIVFSVSDIQYLHKENMIGVDYDKIGPLLTVRTRLPGDRIRLPGRGCSKTLKKYFNEIALPADERDSLPVICDALGVIAAGTTADETRLPDQSTKKLLFIKMERDKNDQ